MVRSHSATFRTTLQEGSLRGYQLRCELVPALHGDVFEEQRLRGRAKATRRREWLLGRSVVVGSGCGAVIGAWYGQEWYGPQGAVGGALVGMVLGGLGSLVLLAASVLALVAAIFYGVYCLLF